MLEEYHNIIMIGLSLSLGTIAYYVIYKISKQSDKETKNTTEQE
jgi:hypothetical protein